MDGLTALGVDSEGRAPAIWLGGRGIPLGKNLHIWGSKQEELIEKKKRRRGKRRWKKITCRLAKTSEERRH